MQRPVQPWSDCEESVVYNVAAEEELPLWATESRQLGLGPGSLWDCFSFVRRDPSYHSSYCSFLSGPMAKRVSTYWQGVG